ncbi:uncharacterized protein Bfra_009372, partial [Botrytis fragariae]
SRAQASARIHTHWSTATDDNESYGFWTKKLRESIMRFIKIQAGLRIGIDAERRSLGLRLARRFKWTAD